MNYLVSIILIIAAVAIVRVAVQRTVLFEYEKGLKYVNGQFIELLSRGVYWHVPYRTTIQTVDMRPKFVSVSGQEVLSADSVTVKISLAAKYQIVDPQLAINHVENYQEAFYLELQLGLREIVSAAPIDELLEQRGQIGGRLAELKREAIAAFGLRLVSVEIKDIMFPGELKKLFAQVVTARKEGLAALEKARAETATLRHLANAARLMDDHPHLMQLRVLQSVRESSGHTLVFGMPAQAAPLPLNQKDTNATETSRQTETPD